MTRAEKAKLVAKDVIKQVKSHKYTVQTGVFADLRIKNYEREEYCDLKDVIVKEFKSCNVCALGSAFISSIKLFNEYDIVDKGIDYELEDGYCDFDMSDEMERLYKIFTRKGSALMEIAFELGRGYFDGYHNVDRNDYEPTENEREKAVAFGKQFKNKENRLIAIMKNVIKNKGIFKP